MNYAYYMPLRVKIMAEDDQVDAVVDDILKYGLFTWQQGYLMSEYCEDKDDIKAQFKREGAYMVFTRDKVCQGEDYGDEWLDSAQKILDHAMPGSYFECYDSEDTDGLYAMRFEHGCEPRYKMMMNPFEVEDKLAEIAVLS